jgi:hypothetical protein
MDIDNSDIDLISCRFRSMNTNDKDHLISEFKRLSKTQLSNDGCCFYLDLAEWNLNTALWAYYEYENVNPTQNNINNDNNTNVYTSFTNNLNQTNSQLVPLPQMKIIAQSDSLESVNTNTILTNKKYVKTWRLINNGMERWPNDVYLRYINGFSFKMDNNELINYNCDYIANLYLKLEQLQPNETFDLSIYLQTPQIVGKFKCELSLCRQFSGQIFGEPLVIELNVTNQPEHDEEMGIMDLAQQLNNVNMFGVGNSSNHKHFNTPSSSSTSLFNQSKSTDSNNISSSLSKSNHINHEEEEEEKRPDFYDDMFS